MKGFPRVGQNPAEQNVKNFLAATNAYAEQLQKSGEEFEFLSVANAKAAYAKIQKMAVALANTAHVKHNEVYNALTNGFGRNSEAVEFLRATGESIELDARELAQRMIKSGSVPEQAITEAFNSLAGNPVFDHFGNLNLLAGQLYQEMAFMESFLDYGDAFALPVEPGSTGLDTSRFRAPVEQVSGSAKVMQGDVNPRSHLLDDANRTQISLSNEFKNAITPYTVFSISQAQRDQALGYEKAVNPALAGFILQNRYFQAAQKQVLKLAELFFVGGQNSAGNYVPGVGGSYGMLSAAIQLSLADWDASSPKVASTLDWKTNPTKLIQKIRNYYYKMATTANKPLDPGVDSGNMYKDIVRLFQLAAQQNVDFSPKDWVLFVPSSWYGLAMQYPSGGTFNKQLQEMVKTATGGKIISNINVIPSALLNAGASIGSGGINTNNYMVAVALGARSETKPIILPGQTAVPIVTAESVSPAIMNFRTELVTGGPMFMHYGGAFILEFSAIA